MLGPESELVLAIAADLRIVVSARLKVHLPCNNNDKLLVAFDL